MEGVLVLNLNNLSGLYRGVVVGTTDPTGLGRLRVSIPVVTGANSAWAFPVLPTPTSKVDAKVGDGVWVAFEGGDRAYPIFVGFFGGRMGT
jgi:hypothetical protein